MRYGAKEIEKNIKRKNHTFTQKETQSERMRETDLERDRDIIDVYTERNRIEIQPELLYEYLEDFYFPVERWAVLLYLNSLLLKCDHVERGGNLSWEFSTTKQ